MHSREQEASPLQAIDGKSAALLARLWQQSRRGSHSGRGFRYQDAVAAHFAIQSWMGNLPIESITPEGFEDISLVLNGRDVHVQAKSQRSHRGDFSLSTVVGYLAEVWEKHEQRAPMQPDSSVTLVLEREIHGLSATGWHTTIAEHSQIAEAMLPELEKKLGSTERAERLIQRTSIVIVSDPREGDIGTLADRLGLPHQACVLHFQALQDVLGEMADENGVRPAEDPAQLTITDIQRIIDEITELVDLEGLDAATRLGICEVVDFLAPLDDSNFYRGVDVVPGHIAAGLPHDRPESVENTITGLFDRRAALIVGPSGAGKSALLWMSAYQTRHVVRWYRIKRLYQADIEHVLRLIRAVRPSERSPIGFAVDDVGQGYREGWDQLVREATQRPGVLLLGAVREEDLFLLQTANRSHQVRPTLEVELAERVWRELQERGETAWPDWREPFELSNGLLLEYSHLLTAGERMRETIVGQVDRRLMEHRDLELEILRMVATADIWGATVKSPTFTTALDARAEDVQRALRRLLNEHLIREHPPGVLGGLHQLRSRHIVDATHAVPPPSLADTVEQILSLLDGSSLQSFVAGALLEDATEDEVVIRRLATRISAELDPTMLIAALQALRLVGFVRLAKNWIGIMENESVPVSKMVLTANLALSGVDLSANFWLPSIRSAAEALSETEHDDPRIDLLQLIEDEEFQTTLERITSFEVAVDLLSSLLGIPLSSTISGALLDLDRLVARASIDLVARLLGPARSLSPDLAINLADRLGGHDALLEQVERERPWVRNLRISTDTDGQQVVEGVVRYVAPSAQPDIHGDVVDLCRLALQCVPSADVAACCAVDAGGEIVGYGDYEVANKRIPRRNLPETSDVAWNRARLRMLEALLGPESRTVRLHAEQQLLARIKRVLDQAADRWSRGIELPSSLIQEVRGIQKVCDELPPPPIDAGVELSPSDQGDLSWSDPVEALVSTIASNLIPRMARQITDDAVHLPALAGLIHGTLLPHIEQISDPDRWRLLSEPPYQSVEAIRATLLDLHTVMSEFHVSSPDGENVIRKRVRRTRRLALEKSAEIARQRARDRLNQLLHEIVVQLETHGYRAHVHSRPAAEPAGVTWPGDEVFIAVEISSLFDWAKAQSEIVSICNDILEPTRQIVAIPLRNGQAVGACGIRIVLPKVFPNADMALQWKDDVPFPFLEERATGALTTCINALEELSGILAGVPLHPDEEAASKAAFQRFEDAAQRLASLAAEDSTGILKYVINGLNELGELVQVQVDAAERGVASEPIFAIALSKSLRGEEDEIVNTIAGLRWMLLEWDLDPVAALDQIESDLSRLEAADGIQEPSN